MKLSVKVDYACRVLAQLARHHGEGRLSHIEDLARIEAVPANYLVQILSELRNGGLITSRRGKQGGYVLSRPPEKITLYDIVKLIEGDLLEFGGNADGQSGKRVQQVWREVRAALEAKCKNYTLDALMTRGPGEMYYI
ncbi:MAG: Rrf2 family transcriptional regulator [Opitutaceae bacterium]|nr:Rrf2 family transcriptional regulator [Opitutaceae bacterium]